MINFKKSENNRLVAEGDFKRDVKKIVISRELNKGRFTIVVFRDINKAGFSYHDTKTLKEAKELANRIFGV